MGLFDFLRSLFPANHNEQLGPNDLPSGVLRDLNSGDQLNPLPYSDNQDQIQSFFNRDEIRGNFHHQSFQDVEKDFENAFHQMDTMFRSLFGDRQMFDGFHGGPGFDSDDSDENFIGFFGSGPHIEYFQGGQSIDANEGDISLREKMLNEATEDQISISPFHNDVNHSDRFEFKFHSPFFGGRRQLEDDIVKNEDQDLDKEFEHGKKSIDDILITPNRPSGKLVEPAFSSIFKSTSISKKINPDGSVETTSRRQDSDGNEEVVTSRILGDQTHSVTIKKNNAGEEERIESFTNMDENDLEGFNKKWNLQKGNSPHNMMITPDHHSKSIIDNLPDVFSTWFKPKL